MCGRLLLWQTESLSPAALLVGIVTSVTEIIWAISEGQHQQGLQLCMWGRQRWPLNQSPPGAAFMPEAHGQAATWPLHPSLHCLFPLSIQSAEAVKCQRGRPYADCSSTQSATKSARPVQPLGAASTSSVCHQTTTPT